MMSFATCIAWTIILITISLGRHDSSEDDGKHIRKKKKKKKKNTNDVNNCQFGENIQSFQRSFDILKTSDCSCNNYQVQYKLNHIAMQHVYMTGILSANRHDAALRECATTKFTSFVQNFYAENLFYETSLGAGGIIWESLNEFLFDGNKDASSFTDLVLNSDTTLIMNTNPGIITDCTVHKKTETVTLNMLLNFYRRPDDVTKSDIIQRSVGTFTFTRFSLKNDYKYLITRIIFKGTRISINNAPRTGTDTEFTTFACENI